MTAPASPVPVAPAWEAPDLSVTNFALCEVREGFRLIGAAIDFPTVYLVLSGDMHMSLPRRPALVAKQGAMVLLPPGIQPSIAPDARPAIDIVASRNSLVNKQGLLVFDARNGQSPDLSVLVGRVSLAEGSPDTLLGSTSEPILDPLREDRLARQAYNLILEELSEPKLGSAALAASLMKTCVILFARRQYARISASDPGMTGPLNSRIAGVAKLIQARPGESYNVQSLAELAGMSRSTFARQFTDLMDATPMEYVLRTRLRHACGLLAAGDMPIKQIAAAAGFVDRSHFSRAFRIEYGVDPTSFRERSGASEPALDAKDAAS